MNLVEMKEEEDGKEDILPSSTSEDYILPNLAVEDTVFVQVEDMKTENEEIKSKYQVVLNKLVLVNFFCSFEIKHLTQPSAD